MLSMAVEPGAILEGTVEKLLDYGVIVSLPEGESGLVHISEVADEYVQTISDYFREGDDVRVKVLAEKEKGRYELSAKQAEPRKPVHAGSSGPVASDASQPFEDKLSDFMKRSSQRINELRRSRDNRRKRGR
jgi:S1 RNA binding domain protein